ncbi:MAG TPA: MBL fold metallo-hydrolase [Candidatus Thermoplasmatota archaeon]|nr:MBL fold metallo-hydrolase [Candidatus Thermoplasmatota archaeon]
MSVESRVERHGAVERLWMAHAPLGRPLYWTTCHLADGVLVDTGCARGRPALQAFLAQRRVEAVLTTHEHEDHVGNHAVVDAPAYAPARAADILRDGPPRLPLYRWLTWGAHEAAPRPARPLAERIEAGGRWWRVVPTPGHSGDHVAYLDESSQAAFTGDAYLGKLRAVRAKEDVPLQMESVRRIAALDPATLHPAHGPVLARPRARLLEVADHFDRLREKALRLHERGLSPRRIRQELMGPEPWLCWYSQGAFSAENLVRSLLRAPPRP